MKNKKAELTTRQIILLIILIASFAVILILLFRLDLGKESDKEICHNSVVLRGNSIISKTDAIPLNCKRQYVCITEDGSCEQMLNPVEYRVDNKEEVFGILANEMADCWWMFGEGKVNYVGKETVPKMHCSLCSQIAFDNSLTNIFNSNTFNKRELYEYLATHKISKDQTYSQYLFNTNDYEGFLDGFEDLNVGFGNIVVNGSKQYYVLTGITSETSTVGTIFRGAGAGAVLAGVFLAPFTGGASLAGSLAIVGSGAVAGGVGGYFLTPVINAKFGGDAIPASLIEVNSGEYESLECKSITTFS